MCACHDFESALLCFAGGVGLGSGRVLRRSADSWDSRWIVDHFQAAKQSVGDGSKRVLSYFGGMDG